MGYIYGIPKPASGCPHDNGFDWRNGWVHQDSEDSHSQSDRSSEFHLDEQALHDRSA